MSGKTFKIVNTLETRLKHGAANLAQNFAPNGIVFGFNSAGEANESFCLGCVGKEVDIPFGMTTLGAFFLGDNFDEASVLAYCASITKSKKSGKLIVLQHGSELKVSGYDIKSKSLGVCANQIVPYQDGLSGLVTISLRATFHLKCTYYLEKFNETIENAFQEMKQTIVPGTFSLDGSPFKLSSDTDANFFVEDLYTYIEQFDELADVQIPANMKKKMIEKLQRKLKSDKVTLKFVLSNDESSEASSPSTIELKEGASIDLLIPITINYLVPLTNQVSFIFKTFTSSLTKVLTQLESALLANAHESVILAIPKVNSFFDSASYSHPITVIYSNTIDEDKFNKEREYIHLNYIVPLDKPAFKALKPSKDSSLAQVHVGLTSGVKNGQPVTVSGKYLYFHYNQNQMNDSGWGCAYRSLQTIISWFQLQGYIDIDRVPNHEQIQQALVDVGDKPANFVGSSKWIGSQEVCYVLSHLYGISSKIIFINSGSELANKARELIQHFQTNGTPIMIGGGVLAHTIIGVHFDETNGDVKYLVLDPHFTGDDDISVIHKKGWVGWKNVSFWDKNSFYNLCLPQKPDIF